MKHKQPSWDNLISQADTAASPILILSSGAGGGNASVGQTILAELRRKGKSVEHHTIEDCIGRKLAAQNFTRHHWICTTYPFLLNLTYRLPLKYYMAMQLDKILYNPELEPLRSIIISSQAKTVIACNHRAAFWVSSLRRRQLVQCDLWGVCTDYALSPGWRYVHHSSIDKLFGPIDADVSLRYWPKNFYPTDIPVEPSLYGLGGEPGSHQHVLVTGGMWGLGPLEGVATELARIFPELTVHVACGMNQQLYGQLSRHSHNSKNIVPYSRLPNLHSLFQRCASVVSRPGGVTITEAHAAGRQLFLLPGLPHIEALNLRHAERHFGAHRYTQTSFHNWYSNYSRT